MSSPISIISDAWHEAAYVHPQWRRGQALYNVVYEYSPSMGRALLDSDANPYYDDTKIGDTFAFILEYLGE